MTAILFTEGDDTLTVAFPDGQTRPVGDFEYTEVRKICTWPFFGGHPPLSRAHDLGGRPMRVAVAPPVILVHVTCVWAAVTEGGCCWNGLWCNTSYRAGELFITMRDRDDQSWTWQLYDAQWWNRTKVSSYIVGRWPD